MSRLEAWLDDEVALIRPCSETVEHEYREALRKTVRGEALRLFDATDEFGRVVRWVLQRQLRRRFHEDGRLK